MPQIIDNPDGTKSLTVNSSELRVVRDQIVRRLPEIERALKLADTPTVRSTLAFLKASLG